MVTSRGNVLVPKDKKRIRNAGDVERAKPGTRTLVEGCRGLYLVCDPPNNLHPDGLKRWMYRHKKLSDGQMTEISVGHVRIGQIRSVSLDQARLAADAHRYHQKHNKMDPQQVRQLSQGQRKTFADACQEYLRTHGPGKGDRWNRQFKLFTETYGGKLSGEAVATILPERIREVIAPVFARTWRQGRDTLGLWEDIFNFARTRSWRTWDNPARWEGLHEHNFPRPADLKVENHPAPHYSKMPEFMRALRSYDCIEARQLEFVILTALRPNIECRLIRWSEIDWENRILNVPGDRMKKRRPHRVPLSGRAITLLLQLQERARGPYVFPGKTPDKPIAENKMIRFLRKTMNISKERADVHGLGRNPIRDWCGERDDFDLAAVEMVLAHAFGSQTVRAYFRSDLLDKRRIIMDAWTVFCEGKAGSPTATPGLRLVISS